MATVSACALQVTCSFLEIYNDDLRDLLATPPTEKKGGVEIHAHPRLGTFLPFNGALYTMVCHIMAHH